MRRPSAWDCPCGSGAPRLHSALRAPTRHSPEHRRPLDTKTRTARDFEERQGIYDAFEKLYKECAADAFTKADAELKAKISSVENGIKGAKRDEIVAFYNEYRASLNIPEDIAPFDRCGINITMSDSLKKLQGQASLFLQNVSNDLRMIETLEHKDEVLVEYRKSLSGTLISQITARASRLAVGAITSIPTEAFGMLQR